MGVGLTYPLPLPNGGNRGCGVVGRPSSNVLPPLSLLNMLWQKSGMDKLGPSTPSSCKSSKELMDMGVDSSRKRLGGWIPAHCCCGPPPPKRKGVRLLFRGPPTHPGSGVTRRDPGGTTPPPTGGGATEWGTLTLGAGRERGHELGGGGCYSVPTPLTP